MTFLIPERVARPDAVAHRRVAPRRRHRRRHRRARHGSAARLAGPRGRPAGEERRARRPRRQLRARRVPVRHRRLVVPHARGLRALLRPAGHHGRGRARPAGARPELPGLLRGPRRAARPAPRPCPQPRAVRVGGARRRRGVRRLPPSAEETYDIALRRFLYSNFDSTSSFLRTDVVTPHPAARPAADPLARQPRRSPVLRQPAPPGPGLSRGVPRLVPDPRAQHVPPDEPARPGRPACSTRRAASPG